MDSVVELNKQLIRRPSVTPVDADCQKIISERLNSIGFHCEFLPFGNVENLWAKYGTHSPLFVFAGHTDVVPPGPLADWISPPFDPTIRGEYLYGRGASDMKSGIAAMLIATEKFIKEHPNFSGSIAFLITSDEEAQATDGTKKVMEILHNRCEKIDYCIVGEPSSDQMVGDQIRVGRRGSLHGKLTIHGKQGHVAHPHLAENPIHLCMPALYELTQTEWDKGNMDFPPTTFQMTNIHSGTGAANVIPGHLDVIFNFRFSSAITIPELKERTQTILHKHGLTYDLKWEIGAHPFLTQKGKLITAVKQAIKEVTDLDVRLSTGGGTSDGRFIAPTGAQLVELGVTHATAHQANESVRIKDLEDLTTIYYRLLTHLFN